MRTAGKRLLAAVLAWMMLFGCASAAMAEEAPDGYVFRWSGGSGRASIRLTDAEERDGQLYATILFTGSHGKPGHYDAVRADGTEYTGDNVFTIPVNLNGNTEIEARTTAMSQPHWITYTLYVGEAGENGTGESDQNPDPDMPDETAPDIPGLRFAEEITEGNAALLKIFRYEDAAGAEYLLLETDLGTRVTGASAAEAGDIPEPADEAEAAAGEEDGASDGTEAAEAGGLYAGSVVRYLVFSEGAEVPAGLDREYVIISRPIDRVCAASAEALHRMEEMGLTDLIAAAAVAEEDIVSEEIRGRLADGSIAPCGTADDMDYRELIRSKADLIILPGSVLAKEGAEDAAERAENFRRLTERAATLGIPVIADCSADEKDEKAAEEWNKLYEAVFG